MDEALKDAPTGENSYLVYMHRTPSNKVYIGITKQKAKRRWNAGNGYRTNKHFFNAIKKYGWKNIDHIVIHENLTMQEAKNAEIYFIAIYQANNKKYGYNLTRGGDHRRTGFTVSEETRERISKANKGRQISEETRKKISEAGMGRTVTIETRMKISAAQKGKKHPPQSLEQRKKHSEAIKGKIPWNKGRKMSDAIRETKRGTNNPQYGKPSPRRKAVICLETGLTYDCITHAAKENGLSFKNISAVCRGKRKTAGGLHWQYLI